MPGIGWLPRGPLGAIDATGAFEQATRRFKHRVLAERIKTIGEGISITSSALRNTSHSLRDPTLEKAATNASLVLHLRADWASLSGTSSMPGN
jgi:hypothetical protein